MPIWGAQCIRVSSLLQMLRVCPSLIRLAAFAQMKGSAGAKTKTTT